MHFNHWQRLTRFLGDGRLELDTNPVENAIRPICLTRKNALLAGHEIGAENWALLAPLQPASSTNPAAYIAETLEAIIDGYPHIRIGDLIPWRFRKASNPASIGPRLSAYGAPTWFEFSQRRELFKTGAGADRRAPRDVA